MTRSRIKLRSSSATAARTVNTIRPVGLLVSMLSFRLTESTSKVKTLPRPKLGVRAVERFRAYRAITKTGHGTSSRCLRLHCCVRRGGGFAKTWWSQIQKFKRNEPCITRGERALVGMPKRALVWLPFALKVIVASMSLKLV